MKQLLLETFSWLLWILFVLPLKCIWWIATIPFRFCWWILVAGGWRVIGRKIAAVWKWIGDADNSKAFSVVFQFLTLAAAAIFGILGVIQIANISVNLREIKADVVDAGQVRTDSVNFPAGWELGTE